MRDKDLDVTTAPAASIDLVRDLVQPLMKTAVDSLARRGAFLAGMARYHLGWVDESFAEAANVDQGKRMRPELALLCCRAAGGTFEQAAPLAAAIELLHNFTLVHDDIQDRSPTRRHRPTVWSLWGDSQAINAGDALFAAAQLALLGLGERGTPPAAVAELALAFNEMTIAIVAGQVADLSFESRSDVAPDEYLAMIEGKTAAIVQFATWAGARLAGSDNESAVEFGEFGLALGLGFQIQDDLLGVWAPAADTGKAAADDIRRKKKSLPVVMLHERANPADRAALDRLYSQAEIDSAGVRQVLDLLGKYRVRAEVEAQVQQHHDRAVQALLRAAPNDDPARTALLRRVALLATRSK